MDIIEKALKLRKSIPLKSKEPDWAFQNRLHKPLYILSVVEDKKPNNSILYEVRRQYLVALAAAFEIYWRDFFKVTIDTNKSFKLQLSNMKKQKFSLEDLQKIIGSKLTIGELVSCAYVFQSSEVINQVCSEIFNFELFKKISKSNYRITIKVYTSPPKKTCSEISGTFVLKERVYLEKCFQVRHETVHDTGARYRISRKNLLRMQQAISLFNYVASLELETYIEQKIKT